MKFPTFKYRNRLILNSKILEFLKKVYYQAYYRCEGFHVPGKSGKLEKKVNTESDQRKSRINFETQFGFTMILHQIRVLPPFWKIQESCYQNSYLEGRKFYTRRKFYINLILHY